MSRNLFLFVVLSIVVSSNAQLLDVKAQMYNDDDDVDLKSLCAIAIGTNLGEKHPGKWNCSGSSSVDRRTACKWNGILCDKSGFVISLILSTPGFQGTLHSSIGYLVTLREINLASNKLSSSIPSSIGYLTALTSLNLKKNKLTSSIPTAIGLLTSLENVFLSSNHLTGLLPSSIGRMTALTNLAISKNSLMSSLPSSLGFLAQLESIKFDGNMFTSRIPTSICQLKLLYNLQLSYNTLTSIIPTCIGFLTSLRYLEMDHNRLSRTIPTTIGLLTALHSLKLSYNRLTSLIPTSVWSLTSLVSLALASNRLSSTIPSTVGQLTLLSSLALSINALSGPLPSSIGVLTSLVYLSLWGGNKLTSSIPSTIGFLKSMTTMWLTSNAFSSAIPSSLGQMTSLKRLGIAYTKVSSSIPTTIGYLTSLITLYMSGNAELTSVIPSSIGFCTALQLLRLSYNALSSVIPTSLASLTTLKFFHLQRNKMTSSIPSTIGMLASLQVLLLNNNKLISTVPSSVGQLSMLTRLDLSANRLTSSIPLSVWKASSLNVLFLKGNHLTGTLPTLVGQQSVLKYLDLSNNMLGGSIPTSIGSLTNLIYLGIGHNTFSSSIPTTLGLLKSIQFMTLNDNLFTSSVPVEVALLSKLKILGLENNRFIGLISGSVCQPNLGYFTAGGNNLECVPWCQDDYAWESGKVSLPRCQDEQDAILYDIETSLGVSAGLEKVSVRSLSVTIETPHPTTNSYSKYIAEPDVFEYSIEMLNYDMTGYLSFCVDSECNSVIGKYGPDMLYYLNPATNLTTWIFVNRGNKWLTPLNVPVLIIKQAAFYVKFQYSGLVCPVINYNYQCPVLSFGFQFTLTSRIQQPVGWKLDRQVPYSPPSLTVLLLNRTTVSPYAAGLCQSIWKGVKCDKGRVSSLDVSGLALQGTIPTSIGRLTALTSLDLSGNLIRGAIVSSIALLTLLDTLSLSFNSFSGTLPSSFLINKRLYDLSLSNNKLTGSIPATLISRMTSLNRVSLDGNLFTGEVALDVCAAVLNRNVSVNLIASPSLTCYQEQCTTLMQSNQRKYIVLDPALGMCVPTSNPTVSPTASPTLRSTSKVSGESTGAGSLLSSQETILVGIFCPLIFALIVTYFIWRKRFSEKAEMKLSKKQILRLLPIHKFLLRGPGAGNITTEDYVMDIIESNIDTVLCCDGDGNTVLDIIVQNHIHKRVTITPAHIRRLLLESLPTHIYNNEESQIESSLLSNRLEGTSSRMSSRLFKLDDIPRKPLTYGWCLAVQQDDKNFVAAVEMILTRFREHVKALGDIRDENGRACKDIAGSRTRESISRKLYLAERYDLKEGHPEHKSATSLVILAVDHGVKNSASDSAAKKTEDLGKVTLPPNSELENILSVPSFKSKNVSQKEIKGSDDVPDKCLQVAVKMMKNRDQFIREVHVRKDTDFNPAYVLPIITYYGDVDDDMSVAFRGDSVRKGYGSYPYCIVMEAGKFSLKHVIDHEQVAGQDWNRIKDIVRNLTIALHHIHEKGVVHGDVKPSNILFVGMSLKLIDFDASASFKDGGYVGLKYSSGYIPPEMFVYDVITNEVRVRKADDEDGLLLAHPSVDMWALGCVLYLLATGATLVHTSVDDNIAAKEDFNLIYNWDADKLAEKLSCIPDKLARNLLSLLLERDPKKRMSSSRVLDHPFLTGKVPCRLEGEKASNDVFLSYRVSSDAALAKTIYDALIAKGLTVWWDKMCLIPGQNWEEGFCQGLTKSSCFVCLMSRNAIKHRERDSLNFEKFTVESPCDNVLIEWRLALDLKERGMITGIFPVMIGDFDIGSGLYGNYLSDGCHPRGPDVAVDAVEMKVRHHLERMGLGAPYDDRVTVKAILEQITSSQGGFLMGPPDKCLPTIVGGIIAMVKPKNQEGNLTFAKVASKVININQKRWIDELKSRIEYLSQKNVDLSERVSDADAKTKEVDAMKQTIEELKRSRDELRKTINDLNSEILRSKTLPDARK